MNKRIDSLLSQRRKLLKDIIKSRRRIKEADDDKKGRLVSENQAYLSAHEVELTEVDQRLDSLQGSKA